MTAATITATVEWGVRLDWPDGWSETVAHNSRESAERAVRVANGHNENPATATLVSRPLGEWTEA